MREITKNNIEKTVTVNPYSGYDNYIAVDWSQKTMAIARLSCKSSNRLKISEQPSDVKALQQILKSIQGKKIVVVEESSPAHWLYIKLHDYAEKIVICDPYRNRLLSEGPKNDPIDARKLCQLLHSGLVKEVYHSDEEVFELRKYVSNYIDLIKMGVRLQNQRSGFLSQEGKTKKTKTGIENKANRFIIERLDKNIALYEEQKDEYKKFFEELCESNKTLNCLCTLHGIAEISAVKILAMMINAGRFKNTGKFLAYCGLVSYNKESGGKVYGRKRPRYCRTLKEVFKTSALAAIKRNNPIKEYYEYMIKEGISEHNARHTIARYLARLSYGIVKTKTEYKPYKR